MCGSWYRSWCQAFYIIADTLTAMDEEIEALEIERDKMIQIREGAIDDLLTGRFRLKGTVV